MRRTPEQLIEEFRTEVGAELQQRRLSVQGQLRILQITRPQGENPNHSAVFWVLQAHLGTLEKLGLLFRRDGNYETFELLAIARNIFENLVWLRLMRRNRHYGLVFYASLLKEQMQHNAATIEKWENEAALFDEAAAEEDEIFNAALGQLPVDPADDNAVLAATAARQAACADLDQRIRRKFCIYGEAAAQNGYLLQAQMVRDAAIPEVLARQEELVENKKALDAILEAVLPADLFALTKKKWNWFQQAESVGMQQDYKFLYSYTSKLLHSTAMNIITDKELAPEEQSLILDYIVVSALDLIEEIEEFHYDGKVRVLAI